MSLEEVRARHVEQFGGCLEDGQPWPCDASVALDRNARLEAALGDALDLLGDKHWFCPSCHRPCVSEGMCQTCGIFALRYESMLDRAVSSDWLKPPEPGTPPAPPSGFTSGRHG